MHDTRTNQFDIQLQHLKSDSGFEAPRFAIEFVIVSYCKGTDGCQKQNLTRIKTTSIDDEHTPGIFSVRKYSQSLKIFNWVLTYYVFFKSIDHNINMKHFRQVNLKYLALMIHWDRLYNGGQSYTIAYIESLRNQRDWTWELLNTSKMLQRYIITHCFTRFMVPI